MGAGASDLFPGGEETDFANLAVIHRNTLPPRANFHLYDSEKDCLSRDISKSRAVCLSGKWRFRLTTSPLDAIEGFELNSHDSSQWSTVDVPGMWQLQGHGRGPHYTNIQYPFHVDPPFPPYRENETGHYIRSFTVPKEYANDQLRLRFEGVDSAFHVWVNGRKVGYSQGARNPSEFDITDYIHKSGENTLAVKVYQFCNGSYIEDQDQWWLSGIFRDVYLLAFPKDLRFEDFTIDTYLDHHYKDARLKIHADITGAGVVHVKLLDSDYNELVDGAMVAGPGPGRQAVDFSFDIINPHKWTAETPYLYHLVLSIDGELFTGHRVGFRQVEVKDGLLKINGQRVVFKGANRHEHHPLHGRAVPYEFMKQDLILMKAHNLNAIRTCHQPSDPRMYDLADELGLYVMDEADLECHGFGYLPDAHKYSSDNPEWKDSYVDRAQQLVYRDRLHPSVVIWSLGNEAFYGENHTEMVKWIKSVDLTRPIHYEPDYNADHVDIYSKMYTSPEEIVKFVESKSQDKPLVLCEFIHAMGTGPGAIKEYIEAFYSHPALQGGWVWEWANHGLLTQDEHGNRFYGYGGDFGDEPNDGNFVMDGVLNSDHTPNSGLIEYKKCVEPVQVSTVGERGVKITNRRDFATLDDLVCHWRLVSEDGRDASRGIVELPKGIKAGETAELRLPQLRHGGNNEAMIELSFRLKERAAWAPAGYEVAWGEVPLSPVGQVVKPSTQADGGIDFKQVGSQFIVTSKQNVWIVDLAIGALSSWKKQGVEMIAQPLEPSFYRAPTDNDSPQDGWDWRDRRLQYANVQTRGSKWAKEDDRVVVELRQKFGPAVIAWYIDLETRYTFKSDGSVEVFVKGTPGGNDLPRTLPRIGVTLGLPADYQTVQWFGRGPGESYKDMKTSQRVGVHGVSRIDQLWTAPDYPQECSNRTDTRWVRLASHERSLTAQFFKPELTTQRHLFDFQASHFDVKDIDAAKHPFELEKKRKDWVVLRLDADHHGLGTASCGPKTLDKYALKTEQFEFGILLF
ncbi:hypothetical protein AMS68_003500 [Peltaster fructicola]|uniref:beta-galactosidase n=1 Tax=Peltaster fructicola TaxID=286661 RepID=A0A6H0XTD9_9PEZI|nr:hypothetical protein AMS68_003500 [Peltaster fructicola]